MHALRFLCCPQVPTVAMAGKFAFGRMAQSFYKTMGLEKTCCIASDVARQANSAIVHVAIVLIVGG